MDKKKILIICLITIIVVSIITNVYILLNRPTENKFQIDGINTAENKDILKDAELEGFKITNASLLTRDGISTYKAQITNNSDETLTISKLYVNFYENDTENKTLGLANVTLKPGNTTYINITSETDLTKTTKITYTIEK